MTRTMTAEPDLEEVGRAGRRLIWRLTGALVLAVIVIGVLWLAYSSEKASKNALKKALDSQTAATRASSQAQAVCRVAKVIADVPLQSTVTRLGLSISAGFRVAYVDAGCNLGRLNPADPRVVPLLPPGARYR
jgi:hypothetical protein